MTRYVLLRIEDDAQAATLIEDMASATDAGDVAMEWGAEWADGGYCPAVPRRNEVFARAHAGRYGTRVIRRYVGPWMLDESGEPTNLDGWS